MKKIKQDKQQDNTKKGEEEFTEKNEFASESNDAGIDLITSIDIFEGAENITDSKNATLDDIFISNDVEEYGNDNITDISLGSAFPDIFKNISIDKDTSIKNVPIKSRKRLTKKGSGLDTGIKNILFEGNVKLVEEEVICNNNSTGNDKITDIIESAGNVIDTGIENDINIEDVGPVQVDIDNNTDTHNITINKNDEKVLISSDSDKASLSPDFKEEAVISAPVKKETPKRSERKKHYDPLLNKTVQLMSSLKGFAPLGMLFVLMDVLRGCEEGIIHVNQLAKALDISKPSMLAQLENLEAAGLIRTLSSSRIGRHIELICSNIVQVQAEINSAPSFPSVISRNFAVTSDMSQAEAPGNFSFKKLEFLTQYLNQRGVQVVSTPDESDMDPRLAQTSAFMGKYLEYIRPFYAKLKSTLNRGEEFSYSLNGFGGRDVTHTLNFCKMLHEVECLASYVYKKSPQCRIIAKVNRTPAAINFLSGGWLEHFIRDRIISTLTTHPATLELPYAFMKNPRIILPGEEDFELDFLLTVGGKIFWIEAKTGEYMDFLAKYSRVSKLLGLNRNTSMMVSVDSLTPNENLTARFDLSCCNIDEFANVFRLNLVRELS